MQKQKGEQQMNVVEFAKTGELKPSKMVDACKRDLLEQLLHGDHSDKAEDAHDLVNAIDDLILSRIGETMMQQKPKVEEIGAHLRVTKIEDLAKADGRLRAAFDLCRPHNIHMEDAHIWHRFRDACMSDNFDVFLNALDTYITAKNQSIASTDPAKR